MNSIALYEADFVSNISIAYIVTSIIRLVEGPRAQLKYDANKESNWFCYLVTLNLMGICLLAQNNKHNETCRLCYNEEEAAEHENVFWSREPPCPS